MKRVALSFLFLLATVGALYAQAVILPGPGRASTGSPPAYTGPGDVVISAGGWFGLRAYSLATRGNAAINVCNVSDVVCTDFSTDATSGVLTITTVGGSSCSVVTCTVKTIYDQSGGGNDLVQTTIANRAVLTVSCLSGLPCLTFTSTKNYISASGPITTQPMTFSAVAQRNASFTSQAEILTGVNTGASIEFGPAANQIAIFGGATERTAAATDSVFHTFQAVLNGSSSVLYVNGGSSALATPGTAGYNGGWNINGGLWVGVGPMLWCEAGGWPVGFNSTQAGDMNANQRAYWGF